MFMYILDTQAINREKYKGDLSRMTTSHDQPPTLGVKYRWALKTNYYENETFIKAFSHLPSKGLVH